MIPFNEDGLMMDVCRLMELLEPPLGKRDYSKPIVKLGSWEPGPEIVRMREYATSLGKAFARDRELELIKLLVSK